MPFWDVRNSLFHYFHNLPKWVRLARIGKAKSGHPSIRSASTLFFAHCLTLVSKGLRLRDGKLNRTAAKRSEADLTARAAITFWQWRSFSCVVQTLQRGRRQPTERVLRRPALSPVVSAPARGFRPGHPRQAGRRSPGT